MAYGTRVNYNTFMGTENPESGDMENACIFHGEPACALYYSTEDVNDPVLHLHTC